MKLEEAILRIKEHIAVHQYKEPHAIYITEALEMAIDALKKQIPQQIKEIHVNKYYCPSCESENNAEQGVVWDLYCPQCGQALKMYEGET